MADETVIESQRVFDGRLIKVRVDTVRVADGSEHRREVVEHPGAVALVPVLPNGDFVLVRQYRHPVGQSTLELPAGTREPGEPPLQTAIRELREETGYSADDVRELLRFYVSPGWADEEVIIFVATGLKSGEVEPEADEDLQVVTVQAETVTNRIRSGEIIDSKSIIGLLGWLGTGLKPD
ncbi:MAG: NUDIX hydrolase [Nitrolancea sp.]